MMGLMGTEPHPADNLVAVFVVRFLFSHNGVPARSSVAQSAMNELNSSLGLRQCSTLGMLPG